MGVTGSEPSFTENRYDGQLHREVTPIGNHNEAARLALDFVRSRAIPVDFVGHRFVHGGNTFTSSVVLDEQKLPLLKRCVPLAPIHSPIALGVVRGSRALVSLERQYMTFDNAVHATIPPCASAYLLPRAIVERFGFRKYGFHGLSYAYVVRKTSEFLQLPAEQLRIVACHLGTGGSSVGAILGGQAHVSIIEPDTLVTIQGCTQFLSEDSDALSRLAERGLSILPEATHLLFCDTAFFVDLLEHVHSCAVPASLSGPSLRRHGGCGICHQWVWDSLAGLSSAPPSTVVSVCLGEAPNVVAIRDGKPVETTMWGSRRSRGSPPPEARGTSTRPSSSSCSPRATGSATSPACWRSRADSRPY
ncbi:MAG: acetate/propionate family kinase [Polyangiaceae bacterium]|nr:acetate/propionate family kinase [Polyangiaceae bacterium]